jgi:hypothetical protein
MSNLTGEGPEGLKRIFELFSIGFQTNSGKIGFYDEGGPESRTGPRCEDGERSESNSILVQIVCRRRAPATETRMVWKRW